MAELTLKRWEREFRRDAKADKLAIFADHLRSLDLQVKPELMLEGTIRLVEMCCVYYSVDGRSFAPFLEMQSYDPARSGAAKYAFTFDLGRGAFARALVERKMAVIDLADLYSHPWSSYSRFWITRTDGIELTNEELVKLEEEVTNDLRYDYSEDELHVWFYDLYTHGALLVGVNDREEFDEE